MSITLRAKRILTGALAGALVLGLLPAGVASAATTACQGAASGTFTDSNPTHQANIDCIGAYDVVNGFADGTFGGSQNITRGQMASIIAQFAATTQNVAITDIAIAAHTFTDVAGNVHADNIARIFGLGVTAGRTATTFAPNDTITRAEAATMLANAHVALGVSLAGVTPSTAFTDLGTSVHASNINILAGAGVVSGKTATTFAPSASILRAETATLLVRSITVLRSQNKWDAPALVAPTTNQTLTVSPAGAITLDGSAGNTNTTYTVSGLTVGATYDISLVNRAANWQTGAQGERFAFAAGNRTADFTGAALAAVGDAVIDRLNGASVSGATVSHTATATSATFRVLWVSDGADAFPVVTERTTGATANIVTANLEGTPRVAFGIGGRLRTTAAAVAPFTLSVASEAANTAAAGNDGGSAATLADPSLLALMTNTAPASAAILKTTVNLVATTLPTQAELETAAAIAGNAMWLRDGDVYQYQGAAITKEQFIGLYRTGTVVHITYRNGATPSTFNITTAVTPTVPTTVAVSDPANTGKNDLTLTITETAGAGHVRGFTQYLIQRRPIVGGINGDWVTVATVTSNASAAATTYTDVPANGTWGYKVRAVSPVSGLNSAFVAGDNTRTVPGSAVAAVAVNALRTFLITNASPIDSLSQGDVVKLVFDKPISQPAAGATISYGANVTLNSATGANNNATFTVNTAAEVVDGVSLAAGRVLTITINKNIAHADAAFGTGTISTNATAQTGIVKAANGAAWAFGNGYSLILRDTPQ